MPVTKIKSAWSSGELIFYEGSVGRSTTGDVLKLGTSALMVGNTAQDIDFQYYGTGSLSAIIDCGAATFTLVGISQSTNKTMTFTGTQAVVAGTSGTLLALTAGTPIVSVYSTCASTGTDGTPVYISHTLSAAGGVGVGLQTNVGVTLAGGNYVAALYGVLTFATAGRITGIASGVVGEVVLSAGTTQGTYCGLNSELVANSEVSSGSITAFFYCNIAGSNTTGKTTLNTNGYLLYLGAGVADTASGLFDTFSEITPKAIASLRISIGGVPYYIPIHDEADFAD